MPPGPTPAVPPTLPAPSAWEGRWVILSPISADDYATLFSWRTDLGSMYLWQHQRRVPTFEEFAEGAVQLFRSTLTLIIRERRSGNRIGLLQLYNINFQDGWAYFMMYLIESHRNRFYGGEAALAFGDYAFAYFNFRKVYAEVFGFNKFVLDSLLAQGFIEEGRLRGHTFWNGKFWDVHHLALCRDKFNAIRESTSLRLVVEADMEEANADDSSS